MDVAWSPHDVWLASCSVDNTIVIWNARKFPGRGLQNQNLVKIDLEKEAVSANSHFLSSWGPEMVACLRGHTGLVKGLTWDPVGKYIASQADDHSLKVWRTVDWQMEANITKPFSEVRTATMMLLVETSGFE